MIDTGSIDVLLGLEVGESERHATAVTPAEKKAFGKPLLTVLPSSENASVLASGLWLCSGRHLEEESVWCEQASCAIAGQACGIRSRGVFPATYGLRMTRTTPARPVSVEAVFPELASYRGRTTRLHPRPGRPGMRDSHVGGPMLWPYGEPWPVCHEPHRPETEGYAPAEIRSARAAGVWPRSRPWLDAGAPGEDGPVPFVGLAQFFRRDIPGLAAGPDGADLVQLFRCPFTHGPHLERRYLLRWRQAAETERAERFLAAPPEVPMLRWEHELPEPCVLHPEEVDTYPWAEDDTLPAPLIDLIDAWEDAQAAEHGPDALSYQGDLSIPPGWRVGGFPSWASTGPMAIHCETCAAPMRLLLTADGYEMDASSHSWAPLEDRDPSLEGKASILSGQSIGTPTRLRFGRDRDLHVFTCLTDPRHPPQWVLS
ncbi:hypothetical protein [Streptomyces sp. NPDC018711]|uniref:hypothetical protein n=1 Tax=Streptomyces sp. NPDC018711 TaxID=3365052 RepID=UPI0037B15613